MPTSHRAITRTFSLLTPFAACLLAAGCETGAPAVSSSTEQVAVQGTVTIGGKPASGGQIMFDPSNVKRKFAPVVSAEIGPDGTYSATTLYGENKISLRTRELATPGDAVAAEGGKSIEKAVAKSNVGKAASKSGALHPNVKRVFVKDAAERIDVEI